MSNLRTLFEVKTVIIEVINIYLMEEIYISDCFIIGFYEQLKTYNEEESETNRYSDLAAK
jgi:hypothetical protein